MALVPCNVCGTLNSEDAEICLSCEYPIKGRRRPAIFQWAAILIFCLFTVPVIGVLLSQISEKKQPQRSPQERKQPHLTVLKTPSSGVTRYLLSREYSLLQDSPNWRI